MSFMVVWCLLGSSVQAHVLLKDKTTNTGAILHINPDDDPIAGEETIMFVDIQDSASSTRLPYGAYDFFITNEAGERQNVPMEAGGSINTVVYTFPNRGVYTLEVASKPAYDSLQPVHMTYSLRVSRGIGTAYVTNQANEWATPLLIMCVTGFVLLCITAFHNRKAIFVHSKF